MNTMITYGKARIADVVRLSLLFQQVYLQTYALEGITFEFAHFIQKRFSPRVLEDLIQNEPARLLVAYYSGNPVGAAEVHFEGVCPIDKVVGPELSKLYVLERFCGQGVGFGLLGEVEKELRLKGHTSLWLEAWENNLRAVQFYQRQQYQIIGRADFTIEATYKNWVMRKSFTP